MRSIGIFGEPVCSCVHMCVVFMYVCERGRGRPERRHSAPWGPLNWRNEVYHQTQKLNLSGKEEIAQRALQRGVQPPVKNPGEIMKPQQDQKNKPQKTRGSFFYPNYCTNPGRHFLRPPKHHRVFPTQSEISVMTRLTKNNQPRNVESNLTT